MAQENEILFRIALSEGDTQQQLQKLVLDLEATKKAQAELTKARKAGTVGDAEYAAKSVELADQLKRQRAEQSGTVKSLELYRKAVNGVEGSYDSAQAALSLAQIQFRGLQGSADNSTEATQVLSAVVRDLRGQLKETDASGLDQFFRSVGDYPKNAGIETLIQQLVQLQETQKSGTLTTEQANKAAAAEIGFKQRIAQAGAVAGLSYEQVSDKVREYGEAIRVPTTALVKLEQEQQKVGEGSEAFTKLGFQVAAARQQIADTPKEVQGVSDTILELDQSTGVFGGHVANLKQQFAQAKQGVELARGSFTGLKGAIAATGIGLLVLSLFALYEAFTKSDEGSEALGVGLAYLKGLFSVVEGVAIGAGKGLIMVFTEPKKAAAELVDFLEGNIINRVKSFGVIWDAIRNGDAKGLANGVIQFSTGVENGIGKVQALGKEMARAGMEAAKLSDARNKLEDDERDSLLTLEQNKNLIDKLVLSAKDRGLSEKERLATLDKAGQLETENLKTTIALADEKLRIAKLTNAEAERTGKTSDDLRQAEAEAATEREKLLGQSLTLQQSIQNRRSALLQQEAADDKAAAQKAQQEAEKAAELRLQLRREALTLQGVLLDRELKQVQQGSDRELNILQHKLNVGRDIEVAQRHLTVGQLRIINAKYESDSLALTLDFQRRRLLAALAAQADLTTAELTMQQQGSDEALRLQVQQIENQRRLALAGLEANADTAAKQAVINATAEQQRRQAEYQEALRLLQQHLDEKAAIVQADFDRGLIGENIYQQRLNEINKAGLAAEAVTNADYQQSNKQTQKKAADLEIKEGKRVAAETRKVEETKQGIKEATLQSYQNYTDALITAFGEETDAGQAALALKKVLGLAEIALNLQKQLSLNKVAGAEIAATIPPPAGPILATAYVIANDALAITAAAAGAASILKLERGGLAYGPSHRDGGIPLYHRGRPAGIEIEGNEAIINKRSTALFLPLLSVINQAGGGRALLPTADAFRHMALGGISSPMVRESLRGTGAEIDYERLAQATAKALRQSPPVTRISDVKAGLRRDAETQKLSSS